MRWLLSVVRTMMIFDDHDVHDDWNISAAWRAEFEAKPWWRARISGAYQSYWIYEHLGNLSPAELATDETWRQVRQAGDAAAVLGGFALRADRRRTASAGASAATPGRAGRGDRLRSRRVTRGQHAAHGRRGGWDGSPSRCRRLGPRGAGHLLPLLLPRGIHGVEAWNEAVCDGAWGQRLARTGERLRQAVDLEHWAAFGQSFENFERLLTGLARDYGRPPASVTVISGDVHNSYLAPALLPGGASRSAIWQASCSPVHNVLPRHFRRGVPVCRVGGRRSARAPRWRGSRGAQAAHPVADQPWSVVRQHARRRSNRRTPGASASTARRGIPRQGTAGTGLRNGPRPDREFTRHSAHAPPEKQFLERSCKRSQRIYDVCKVGSTRVRTDSPSRSDSSAWSRPES